MAKVTDMIGDYADPRGDSGRSVDEERAIQLAGEMRQILNRDLEEVDIALEAYLYNCQVDQDEMIAAWDHLNAMERRAWREYVRIGKNAN
ncbi:MAG TPA: hypothetical protein VN879_16005 [Candidatus Acidoferrales bacterium]|nr:hypothetical protein [Candidatus Acidoferrales bacterium]